MFALAITSNLPLCSIEMTSTQSIKSMLVAAAAQLKIEGAAFEAQLLMQHALGVNRAWLIAHDNDVLPANVQSTFQTLLKRRASGEPMAYIFGYREFYGLKLKVTPDTLIPRPDTETLVEAALAKIPPLAPLTEGESDKCRVLDLGTGSGAIALSLAQHRPQAEVIAVDTSPAALVVAKQNAQNLKIANVRFVLSDWFSALAGEQFDVIVSNPPYIEQQDMHLQQGDLRFEPLSALASGQDGLDDIRRIVAAAALHLQPQGWLLLEHGYNQAQSVADLLQQAGFVEIDHAQDLAGILRVTMGRLEP